MRAQHAFQMVLGEAWSRAFEAALAKLIESAQRGEAPSKLRDIADLWTAETDRVMEEELAGEAYARAQGEMLRATMRYRVVERAFADGILAGSHLASKTDLDQAYRAIADLRREVRALRRERKSQQGGEG
jgi:hypothetical protein